MTDPKDMSDKEFEEVLDRNIFFADDLAHYHELLRQALAAQAAYAAEADRLRAGLRLIADDKHRLMNGIARQTAASILAGKPAAAGSPPPTN